MPGTAHQALYRNTGPLLSGLLVLLAGLVGGTAITLHLAENGDQLMTGIIGVLAVFVLGFVVLLLACLRRHGWTLTQARVQIAERPAVPLTGRSRTTTVPYGAVSGLFSVQTMREEVLELVTRDGRRFVLPPRMLPGEGARGIPHPDQAGLAAFAEALRGAAAAAGHAVPPVMPGLGFWNRAPGILVLCAALVATLALAGIALWALVDGAALRGRAGEALAILVLLPVGIGWFLRQALARRRAVAHAVARASAGSGRPAG